ncbi:uncharacterized protein STEHIDRAFT_138578 [Stereum hirsutum FP-91666 SS1]|uniref:uncharacterized protein n=1 Tax=Stereum hirsutum (strain FP-91666) TaxID=721885 RepID=UPI000440C863|nr:uncharacterized protein STEHIDRAFT_138578 [Stereum hirsutum FP-91666 SS1]EIM88150.1 hypothetical protein STEHIDRAFT_138578 [Stereum hirsutum FP-91666 SS1]
MATDDDTNSRPPSPTSRFDTLFTMGYFTQPFERFVRDDNVDMSSAFTLLDTMETYWDSRIDLLQRKLSQRTDKLKSRAEVLGDYFTTIKTPKADVARENIDREIKKLQLKMQLRMTSLATAWKSARIVRTREKITFFIGVMTVLFTALLFGMAPEWMHIAYTVQAAFHLPLRIYRYKKRMWHYFLFDLCYYVTILNFVYIWILPQSPALFVACYCLSHGSVASAVITWRNSLVFHDSDKNTSLFVHMYPPLVFTVIRHYYPGATERFPALKELPHLNPWKALLLSSLIYLVWQLLYWRFVYVSRRAKVESGERTTSLSFLLNNKRGLIGRALAAIKPEYRPESFMAGQFAYAVITDIPPVFLLYDSAFWSSAYLLLIFAVSAWNGGGFYIEVFGRKFERELEALRKELAEANLRSAGASPTIIPDDLSTPVSPMLEGKDGNGMMNVPELKTPPLLASKGVSEVPSMPEEANGAPPVEESKKAQ